MNLNENCAIENRHYPAVGFGTYLLRNDICEQSVNEALKIGYRIIDTATFYENFIPIGKALKKINRSEVYIISKIWPDSQTPSKLCQDLKITLKQLQTNYLDAYLLHWPNSKLAIEATLRTMEKLREEGHIHHIGLSNVTVNHLEKIRHLNVDLSWVQVEMNPLFCDFELLKFCQANDICIQAWAPLSRGKISKDAVLKRMGNAHKKTASQIALRWIVQHGCLPLVGSKNPSHMLQNFEINHFFLSKEEMHEIDERAKIGKRERVTAKAGLGFTDEFDFSLEECWPEKNF